MATFSGLVMPAFYRSVTLLVACCLPAAVSVAAPENSTPADALQSPPAIRVVLDPGHGGADTGTEGKGANEKDVVLELCRAVARRLEREGWVVFLTRSGDRSVAPELRAALANYREADLFLGIHVSGKGRGRSRGFELFVSPPVSGPADPLRWEQAQAAHREASLRWASTLREELRRVVPSFDRGITSLPNPTLVGVDCPAVLVELGSLAWPDEVAWLLSREGRAAVAEAVARAVKLFASKSIPERAAGMP